MDEPQPSLRHAAAIWGLTGVIALLAQAIVRLAPMAWAPIRAGDLGAVHVAVAVPWVAMMVWTEGVRGFHQRFSPRAVVRAAALPRAPGWVQALAPAACMGLVWATRRRLIASWVLLLGIIALIVGVQQLPYPWRGIVDLGVVAGLGTGLASLLWHAARAWAGTWPDQDPEIPAS